MEVFEPTGPCQSKAKVCCSIEVKYFVVKKGKKIATVYKRLKSSDEGFEVDLPRVAEKKRAIFYCFVNTGYRKLSSRSNFWME